MREEIAIYAQFEAVRRSGKTNMLDKTTVQRIAYECEYFELVNFIEDADNGQYMERLEQAADWFDNRQAGLPVEPVPETVTFETTVTL
ncbi:hypothetical protein DNAM5_6 [Haloarcula californiae tailed virus 1]|uniref:Uncharacterized protein n=1 Tax=Haloarcula californiae tailed virus 1 TaxID=1273746 RepID=R4T7W1_9CAUD|nr:hypothetical protein M202_gp006 [Haloarcula californiae tailed virus 1]AGM11869.1 hypothetical protein DNAM5_6 [Haloarcula californiae tailed virus 1]